MMNIDSSLVFLKKKGMDINIRLSNRQILRGITRSPGNNVRAVILLIHGVGEHVQSYSHRTRIFLENGTGFPGVDL